MIFSPRICYLGYDETIGMNSQDLAKNEHIYSLWERCWSDNKNHNMTLVGRLITKCKQRRLKEVVRIADLLRTQRTMSSTIIDVGCGLGFTLSVFKDMGLDAIGIDVSETAVDICRSKRLKVLTKKLEDVTENYDLVFSDGLIEHFSDFEPYAKHLMRISKRFVVITQTDHDSLVTKILFFLESVFRKGRNVPEYDHKIRDFIESFEKNSFKLVLERGIFLNGFKLLLFKRRG